MTDLSATNRLCRLLYTSRLPRAEGEEEEDAGLDLQSLAAASGDANKGADITGSLLFVDGTFIQILEGPAPVVEATFERICCDLRHRDLQLVDMVDTDERMFGQWNMACLDVDRETRLDLRSDAQEVRFLLNINAAAAVRQMRQLFDEHASSGAEDAPTAGATAG